MEKLSLEECVELTSKDESINGFRGDRTQNSGEIVRDAVEDELAVNESMESVFGSEHENPSQSAIHNALVAQIGKNVDEHVPEDSGDGSQMTTNLSPKTSSSQTEGVSECSHQHVLPASSHQHALCEDCSKSILSYILLIRQFLDNVAHDISRQIDSPLPRCVECVRESLSEIQYAEAKRPSISPDTPDFSTGETDTTATNISASGDSSQQFICRKHLNKRSSVGDAKFGRSSELTSVNTESHSISSSVQKKQFMKSELEYRGTPTDISTYDSKRPVKQLEKLSNSHVFKTNVTAGNLVASDTTTTNQETHKISDTKPSHVSSENNSEIMERSDGDRLQKVVTVEHQPPISISSESSDNSKQRITPYQHDIDHQPVTNKDNDKQWITPTPQHIDNQLVTNKDNENRKVISSQLDVDRQSVKSKSSFVGDIAESRIPTGDIVAQSASQQPFPHGTSSDSQTANDLREYSFGLSSSTILPLNASDAGLSSTPAGDSFYTPSSPQFPLYESVDGILSTLYRLERGLQDVSKGATLWQRLAELQSERTVEVAISSQKEAFVTLARTNADVLGCLVLGTSLLLCGTSRTLCVLVSDDVSTTFIAPLSSVFHEVQHIRSLESLGTTKLSLLDEPELGICFTKLNVWRLEQFTKCVFLNPDTVVVQNCDELFRHDELSAVPDIGWPDCFNSAVFVYKPSVRTFWQLLEFAEKQGSYDGGDQGLLNAYFDTWVQDISKKLSFIYNLMANVSYTYTPAFKQFGRNVKIVQFVGPYKPWHVKFYTASGQIAPSSSVHPTYVQFVYVWLSIFRASILPLFSQEIQAYAFSQNIISASELLRYFPSMNSEVEFLLAPPSVRLRPSESSSKPEKLKLPLKSREEDILLVNQPLTPDVDKIAADITKIGIPPDDREDSTLDSEYNEVFEDESEPLTEKPLVAEDPEKVSSADGGEDESLPVDAAKSSTPLLPGSEVGDYQGMTAWEQGRMDYEGSASSDTIIERLQFLMGGKDRLV